MKNARYLFASALVVLMGCVPSLHELYTDQTLVFDPTIAGRWQQENDEAVWDFSAEAESKSWTLTIKEKEGKESLLKVHLVEIAGKRFFDFYPAENVEIEMGDWLKATLIPGHLFVRVEKTGTNLMLAVLNPDTIEKLLEKKPDMVKHERLDDDRIVLTDNPKGLQTFIAAGLQIEKFFGDPIVIKRIPAVVPVKP